jgi:hypothetical protein
MTSSWWNRCECLVLFNQVRYKICFLIFEFPHEWRRIGSNVEHGTCGNGEGVHLCLLGPRETLDIYCIFNFSLLKHNCRSNLTSPPLTTLPNQVHLQRVGRVPTADNRVWTQNLFEPPEWAIQVSQDPKDQTLWIYVQHFELKYITRGVSNDPSTRGMQYNTTKWL